MKKWGFVLLAIFAWIGFQFYQLISTPGNYGAHIDQMGGEKIISPLKTKFVSITDFQGRTQIYMNFGYPKSPMGSGVLNTAIPTDSIVVNWVDDNTLKISLPMNAEEIGQDTFIQNFNKKVNIIYERTI